MIRHIQNSGIVRTLFKHFEGDLDIFRHMNAYSATLTGAQLGLRRGDLPYLILKIKKINALILKKKLYITYS